MARAGSHLIWGILLIVVAVGCKTTHHPELKPLPQAEVLTTPPKEARFNRSEYPDIAFRDMNNKYAKPLDGFGGGLIPARGMTAAPGMSPGGMGASGLR